MNSKLTNYWEKEAKKLLEGKTIELVRYMSPDEAEDSGWHDRPIGIFFTDGSAIWPSRDSEGNGGGVLFTSDLNLPTIPCLGRGD